MRHAHLALFCFTGLAVASACGDDGRPPASLGTSGSTSGGGKTSRAGSSSQSEAGADPSPEGGAHASAGEGGMGGAAGAGIVYEMAGAPTLIPGLCDPTMIPGKDIALELEPELEGATLLAMTPDELSVVFVTDGDADGALHIGDRAEPEGTFDVHDVELPAGYEAATGAALSSDSLTLILVRSDHSGFGSLSRSARGESFGSEADVTAFSRLNVQKAMSGKSLGWPVLSSDGQALYFVSYFGSSVVVQSARGADGRFDLGRELEEDTLDGGEGAYKRIHAVSADQRAIFYFDEATKHSMARFRSRTEAPFYDPIDLGERRGVAPNADCSRLYSSVDGALVSQDLK